jgi:hypothetical protein
MPGFYAALVLCFSLTASCAVNASMTGGGAPPVASALKLNWLIPLERENGDNLPLAEIGGYELRYRVRGAKKFNTVVVQGASNKTFSMRGLPIGNYEFQIATFDADGLYSTFIPINYKLVR